MRRLRLLLPLALAACALASPLDKERIWTGKNGKKIRGAQAIVTADGQSLDVLVLGKFQRIAIANLSQADQDFIQSCLNGEVSPPPKKYGPSDAFKNLGQPDRKRLPLLNQGEYGRKQSDCVPSSFCNFLLWWDQEGLLPIPRRGDFEDKAEWVHTRMGRYCDTRNTAGTDLPSALEGIARYFDKEIGDNATFRSKVDHDLRPENLARYTRGETATMLNITTRAKTGHDGGHWVALMSAEESGSLVIHTWGARFEGMLKVLEEDKTPVTVNGQKVPKTSYEIEFTNRDSLPQWVRDTEMRFLLFPERKDSIIVIKPYVFAMPGKIAKPPADPLFEPSGT